MEAQDIAATLYRRAVEEGRREEYERWLLLALRLCFGAEADARVAQRLARASLDQLETWADHLPAATSLPELLTVAKSPAAALLTEVIADPRSIAPRLVYADTLLEAGDPRGELIHVQCALEALHADDPARAKLEARAADLLALHEPSWTHDLRELCMLYENAPKLVFRRGFVERARLYASHVREIVASMATQTPLRELSLLHEDPIEDLASAPALMELEALDLPGKATAEELARAFARWPHSGQLRSLAVYRGAAAARAVARTPALAGLTSLSLSKIDREAVMALASAAHLASLRTLRLHSAELDGASIEALGRSEALREIEVLDLAGARLSDARGHALELPALPSLRELRCTGSSFEPATAVALAARPRTLEILDLERVELGDTALRRLLHGPTALEKLRHLIISADGVSDRSLADIFAGLEVPHLTRLVCQGNEASTATMGAIAVSRALDHLQHLDLARCPLEDAGLTALARSEHLPALRSLDLASTGCNVRGLAALGASELGARLVALNLSHNQIDDGCLGALLAGRRLDHLESFVLKVASSSVVGLRLLIAAPFAARLRSLNLGPLDPDEAALLAAADLPELRTLNTGDFDDRAAAILARAGNKPWLQHVILTGHGLTDQGAIAIANATGLDRIVSLWLLAPEVTEVGAIALRKRFGHRVTVGILGSYSQSRAAQ